MEKRYFIIGSDKALEYEFSSKDTYTYFIEQETVSETPSVSYINNQYSFENYLPIIIFQQGLTPFQAVVKYLKENLKTTNKEISQILNRDVKTIWATYRFVEKKKLFAKESVKKSFEESEIKIPLSIFLESNLEGNRGNKLSIFETIVFYLKNIGKKYSEIAKLLGKDQRTIWTVYSRAKNKLAEQIEQTKPEQQAEQRKLGGKID